MRHYYVYIMANRRNGTLYTGVTNDLRKRVLEHRNDVQGGFTKRYWIHRLVYFERHSDIAVAIRREKRIKKWRRAWKLELIESQNPVWRDLYDVYCGDRHPAVIPAKAGIQSVPPVHAKTKTTNTVWNI